MRIHRLQIKKHQNKKNLLPACLLLICLCFLLSACALSAQRAHPEFEARVKSVEHPVLIPPDVSMLELLPSGLIRQREDWRAAGCRNLQNALSIHLKDQKCSLKPLVVDSDTAQEVAEVRALYRLVHKSMKQQTFNPQQDSHARRRFEYSLGSISALLNKLGADSMIFVSGYDRVSSSGRKALIDLAIADASGTILYFSVKGTIQGKDLRDPASANTMVQELLTGFSRING
jgi:hypothetical protein